MSEIQRCSESTLCEAMERATFGNQGCKGLSVANTLNLQSGNFRMLGVVYKSSAKDKGLLLNVCPWCRGEPGYFKRSTESKGQQ